MRGKVWKFGDNVSTDVIAPGRYFHLRSNLPELAKHCLEDADPNFAANVKPGDFVVGGRNFGLGSSREHAPVIMKLCGAGAVLAQSFARIFFRNAINVGLAAIECDTAKFDAGDELEVDLAGGVIKDLTKDISVTFHPLEDAMRRILADGGLVEHIKKHGDFAIS
jgi:3-isopropylmalate/(R)-2-methylmalate dehydratase small subunit